MYSLAFDTETQDFQVRLLLMLERRVLGAAAGQPPLHHSTHQHLNLPPQTDRAPTGNFSSTKTCHHLCFILLYWIVKLLLCLARNTLSHSSPATDSSVDEINGGRSTGQYVRKYVWGLVMTFRVTILGCIQPQVSSAASVMLRSCL